MSSQLACPTLCDLDTNIHVYAGGVQEAPDSSFILPEVATQADIVRCIATLGMKKKKLLAGICVIQGKDVKLWDLHNFIGGLGGFAEVRDPW